MIFTHPPKRSNSYRSWALFDSSVEPGPLGVSGRCSCHHGTRDGPQLRYEPRQYRLLPGEGRGRRLHHGCCYWVRNDLTVKLSQLITCFKTVFFLYYRFSVIFCLNTQITCAPPRWWTMLFFCYLASKRKQDGYVQSRAGWAECAWSFTHEWNHISVQRFTA